MRDSDKIDAQLGIIKTLQKTLDNLRSETNDGFDSVHNRLKALENEIAQVQNQLDTANIKLQSLIDYFSKADL